MTVARTKYVVASVLVVASTCLAPLTAKTGAQGGTPTFGEFPLPSSLSGMAHIAKGPDGNMWFTSNDPYNLTSQIGVITTEGATTIYPSLSVTGYTAQDIVSGPEDSLWFNLRDGRGNSTTQDYIGETTTTGSVTLFRLPTNITATGGFEASDGLVNGPDGNVWFTAYNTTTSTGGIGRITPSGSVKIYYSLPYGQASGLTVGPDGNMWFTDEGSPVGPNMPSFIGKMNTSGQLLGQFPLSSGSYGDFYPQSITAGPNEALWFTQPGLQPGKGEIGRITLAGSITEYPMPTAYNGTGPLSIEQQSDGTLWFTTSDESGVDYVGQITTVGTITAYPLPTDVYILGSDIATGVDGNLWAMGSKGSSLPEVVRMDVSATLPSPTRQLDYVALGDSYSAGEGAPDPHFITGTDTPGYNMCHRSLGAYPELVHNVTLAQYPDFVFKACSGALINDFFDSNKHNTGEPPQLSWLNNQTRLVTLTIGGNDVGFPLVMAYCATRLLVVQPSCKSVYKNYVDNLIKQISSTNKNSLSTHPTLLNLYDAIGTAAPNAKILVIGYPRLFPEKNIPSLCPTGVTGPTYFTRSDMKWMNDTGKSLDNAMNTAVNNINKAENSNRFVYVNTYDALNGHELCSSQPYINRTIIDIADPAGLFKLKQWSFHPNVNGQAALANVVESYVK